MTEADWLKASDPQAMLAFLRENALADDRRCRLFACACVRRIWPLLTDEASRRAVEVAERFADGLASEDELNQACYGAEQAVSRAEHASPSWAQVDAANAAVDAAHPIVSDDSYYATAAAAANAVGGTASEGQATSDDLAPLRAWSVAKDAERAAQADLLRCIFGNPFRPPRPLPESVLLWNDRLVSRLAQTIYDERRWGDMPLLADAVLDAGCDDEGMLDHFRGPCPHARGCHVLDLLLGKE
jgi:hypothetical protein